MNEVLVEFEETVIVIAYYSTSGVISNDFDIFLKRLVVFKEVFVVYVGNVHGDIRENGNVNFVKFGDSGYDLNSYLLGLEKSKDIGFDQIIFLNNSFKIVDANLFFNCITKLAQELLVYDFVGLVKSFEDREHYQSFCFGLSFKSVDGGFFKEVLDKGYLSRAIERTDVIENFELRTCEFLSKNSLSSKTIFVPTIVDWIVGYLNFFFKFGFIDSWQTILCPKTLNLSTYAKWSLRKLYGIEKKKSSSVINKLKYFFYARNETEV